MKIKSIKICNLTSLKGEHEIKLPECGLLAITGATGAGKSSILDAITLALFGKIARFASLQDAPFISKGTGFCKVSVIFSVADDEYCAEFSQQRANKKPGAKLQLAKRSLAKNGEVVASKIKDCEQLITQITGLNYESFINSVILPQGRFANFLHSKDKSTLLALFANLKIYEIIGRLAYEKAKNIKQEIQALDVKISSCKEQANVEQCQREFIRQKLLSKRFKLLFNRAQNRLKELENYELERKNQQKFLEVLNWVLTSLKNNDFTKIKNYQNEKENKRVANELKALLDSKISAMIRVLKSHKKMSFKTKYLDKRLDVLNAVQIPENRAFKLLDKRELEKEFLDIFSSFKNSLESQNKKMFLDKKSAALAVLNSAIKLLKNWDLSRYLSSELELLQGVLTSAKKLENAKISECKNLDDLKQDYLALKEKKIQELNEQIKAQITQINKLNAAQNEYFIYKLTQNLVPNSPCPVCASTQFSPRKMSPKNDESTALARANSKLGILQNSLENIDQDQELANAARFIEQKTTEHENYLLAKRLYAQLDGHIEWINISSFYASLQAKIAKNQALFSNIDLRFLQQVYEKNFQAFYEQKNLFYSTLKITLEDDLKSNIAKVKTAMSECEFLGASKLKALVDFEEKLALNEQLNAVKELLKKLNLNNLEEFNQVKSRLQDRKQKISEAILLARDEFNQAKLLMNVSTKQLQDELKTFQFEPSKLIDDEEFARLSRLKNELNLNISWLIKEPLKSLKKPSSLDATSLEMICKKSKDHKSIKQAHMAEFELKRALDNENKAKELETQRKSLLNNNAAILDLAELIGDAEGKKFNSYAQQVALRLVIKIANTYLEQIFPRYEIAVALDASSDIKNSLEINVKDLHAGGILRPSASLSGGETFVVSLALALGLTQLASRRFSIDSLFLDEGFGSLDERSLEIALNALINLCESEQNKLIGIISHVPNLAERIGKQIRVISQGDGSSRIESD